MTEGTPLPPKSADGRFDCVVFKDDIPHFRVLVFVRERLNFESCFLDEASHTYTGPSAAIEQVFPYSANNEAHIKNSILAPRGVDGYTHLHFHSRTSGAKFSLLFREQNAAQEASRALDAYVMADDSGAPRFTLCARHFLLSKHTTVFFKRKRFNPTNDRSQNVQLSGQIVVEDIHCIGSVTVAYKDPFTGNRIESDMLTHRVSTTPYLTDEPVPPQDMAPGADDGEGTGGEANVGAAHDHLELMDEPAEREEYISIPPILRATPEVSSGRMTRATYLSRVRNAESRQQDAIEKGHLDEAVFQGALAAYWKFYAFEKAPADGR